MYIIDIYNINVLKVETKRTHNHWRHLYCVVMITAALLLSFSKKFINEVFEMKRFTIVKLLNISQYEGS